MFLNSLHAGYFHVFFCRLLIFFQNQLIRKLLQEYDQGVNLESQISLAILLGLIWVQTVCKVYRQTTKFTTGKERVENVFTIACR